MGSGIAQVFAQAGWQVELVDTSPGALEKALGSIGASLQKFVDKGRLSAEDRSAALARIRVSQSLEGAAQAGLVIEAIVEDRAAKEELHARLGRLCPQETVLASNTSAISITALGRASGRPDRFVGIHFMNPVPLMQLVEVIRGQGTSPSTLETALEVCRKLGKTPVEASDYPGFISNRILMPMINEAVYALMEGVGTVEAIDTVMRLGMNHPMGPLALADLIGLDVCLDIMEVLHQGLGDKYRPCPLLRRMVEAGQLGRKSGRGFYSY
jgi:3-hydroxybutyryl-CoA dehydrogenase